MKQGFTLIELLIVVLIIGILAAVALPQYQKAVWRARFAQLVSDNNALVKAQKLYFLANGHYTTNLDELDIDIGSRCHMQTDASYTMCFLYKNGKPFAVLEEVLETGQFDCCSYKATNYEADALCMAETNNTRRKTGTGEFRCYTRH